MFFFLVRSYFCLVLINFTLMVINNQLNGKPVFQ